MISKASKGMSKIKSSNDKPFDRFFDRVEGWLIGGAEMVSKVKIPRDSIGYPNIE